MTEIETKSEQNRIHCFDSLFVLLSSFFVALITFSLSMYTNS